MEDIGQAFGIGMEIRIADFHGLPLKQGLQVGGQVVRVGQGRSAHQHGNHANTALQSLRDLGTHKIMWVIESASSTLLSHRYPMAADHGKESIRNVKTPVDDRDEVVATLNVVDIHERVF